jgi:hypothetical protein
LGFKKHLTTQPFLSLWYVSNTLHIHHTPLVSLYWLANLSYAASIVINDNPNLVDARIPTLSRISSVRISNLRVP